MPDDEVINITSEGNQDDQSKGQFELENEKLLQSITDGVEGENEARRVIKLFHNAQGELLTTKRFRHESNYGTAPIVEMSETEVYLWDRIFDIRKRLEETLEKGELYIPDFNLLEDSELLSSDEKPAPNTEAKTLLAPDKSPKGNHPNRVNLFSGIQLRIPVSPATKRDLEGSKFYMHATAFHDTSFGAAIYLYVVALDRHNRPFVYPFASNMDGGLNYAPEHIVSCELRFNHRIAEGEPNEIIDNRYGPRNRQDLQVATDCNINYPSKVDEIEIPKNPKTRLAYWQASQMIGEKTLNLPSSDNKQLKED